MDDWKEVKKDFYGEPDCWVTVKNGVIDFSPAGMKDVKGAENLSYDDYLEIQYSSLNHTKRSLERTFLNNDWATYKGQIFKKTRKNILFDHLYIMAEGLDGICRDDKESHVWMKSAPFKAFKENDCVEFNADIYRYLKTGHGKQIDYGLRNPTNIRQIPQYQLPSDRQILAQAIDDILWETSLYHDSVDRINWPDVRNEAIYQQRFNQLMLMATLRDTSWIKTRELLLLRQKLWSQPTSSKLPSNLLRSITDAEWAHYQPGMIFSFKD